MGDKVLEQLKVYLLDHEADIAAGIDDFGHLVDVFYQVIGREPKWERETFKGEIS